MIRKINLDKLSTILGNILFTGIINKIPFITIESYLLNSVFINKLENGSDQFIYNETKIDNLIKETYKGIHITKIKEGYEDIPSRWVAESYIRIFFEFKKSFSFIFSYIPISKMYDMFSLYHEESFKSVTNTFITLINKKSILSILLKKNNLSMSQLSLLTGISKNTIMKLCTSNENIYKTSYLNILLITDVLNVNQNIFKQSLNIVFDNSIYQFDKTNIIYRSYLGLLYISFIDNNINKKKWEFDKQKLLFIDKSNNETFLVKYLDYSTSELYDPKYNESLIKYINNLNNTISNKDKSYLVVFDFNQNNEEVINTDKIKNPKFKRIYIINQYYILNVYTKKVIKIDNNNINTSIIRRARECSLNYSNI